MLRPAMEARLPARDSVLPAAREVRDADSDARDAESAGDDAREYVDKLLALLAALFAARDTEYPPLEDPVIDRKMLPSPLFDRI